MNPTVDPVPGITPKGQTLICGDCWQIVRPNEYEPNTFNPGLCALCGADGAAVHRVARAELAGLSKVLLPWGGFVIRRDSEYGR